MQHYQEELLQSPTRREEQMQLSYVTRNAQMLEMDLILISPSTSQDHAIEVAPIASVSPDLLNVRRTHSSVHERKDEPQSTSPSSLIPSHLQLERSTRTTNNAGNNGEFNPTRVTQQPLRSYDPMLLPRLELAHPQTPPRYSFSEEEHEHDQTHEHDMEEDHEESSFPLKYVFVPLNQTSPQYEISKPPLPPSCSPTSGPEWHSLSPAIIWGSPPYPTTTLLPQLGVDCSWTSTTPSFEPIQMTTIDNSWKASDMAHLDSSNISSHDSESMIFSSGDDYDSEEVDEECLDGMKFLCADV